jgi:hypothetical protein
MQASLVLAALRHLLLALRVLVALAVLVARVVLALLHLVLDLSRCLSPIEF